MGANPARLAAWIATADLGQVAQERRRFGDDLAGPDTAPASTSHQLDPDALVVVLQRQPLSAWRVNDNPADDPYLLPRSGKQHAGVDPAAPQWIDAGHLRVSGA